jgi:pilus assembly protein CpaE
LGEGPTPEGVETLARRVMKKSPVMVMDLSAASHPVQKRMIACASHVVAVTTPQMTALRNSRALLTEIKHTRSTLDAVDLVINMAGVPGVEDVPAADIGKILGVEPAAKLPHAPKIVTASEMSGTPLGKNKAADTLLAPLQKIALRAAGRKNAPAMKDAGGKKGALGFLKNIGKKKDA